MSLIINAFLAVLFWNAADEAWEDDRPKWAYCWLFLSALNGAAVMSAIF